MRMTALQLPYATGVTGDILSIPVLHERIAGWDALDLWLDPSNILNPSPWQSLERVSDRSFGVGSGSAPVGTTINGKPALALTGTGQISGAFNFFTAGKTIAMVVQFNALVNVTLMRVPGGQLSMQANGTRPTYVPDSGGAQSMPVGTIAAIDTPYLFMWAFNNTNPAAVVIKRKVGTVQDTTPSIGAPGANSVTFNPFGSLNARIGDVMLFNTDLFLSANDVLRRDVLSYFNTEGGCAI